MTHEHTNTQAYRHTLTNEDHLFAILTLTERLEKLIDV